MIDVSSIIHDPDFEQAFSLLRQTGAFVDGVWVSAETSVGIIKGIVLPAKLDERMVLPEGQRNHDSVAIYSETELIHGDQGEQMPDVVEYPISTGQFYRIMMVRWYAQCNLWYGLATRFQRAA